MITWQSRKETVMDKLKEQGFDINSYNPFEDELPDFETEYSYDQVIELLGDTQNEERK